MANETSRGNAAGSPRRIAIVGFGETAKECPWQDPSWELWGMNGWLRVAAERGVPAPEDRYSLWFDMHTPEYTEQYGVAAKIGDVQLKWLESAHPFPIYTLDRYERWPASVRFPIEEVIEATGRDYFTSTVALALGYALMLALRDKNVAEVGVWGIDLVHETEYGEQRPCAEYFLGRLEGAGVRLTIPGKSALLKQLYRYGYEEENPLFGEMVTLVREVSADSKKKFDELTAKQDALHAEMRVNDAAIQVAGYIAQRLAIWRRGGQL